MKFKERITLAIKQSSLSQKQIAEMLEISESNITNWKNASNIAIGNKKKINFIISLTKIRKNCLSSFRKLTRAKSRKRSWLILKRASNSGYFSQPSLCLIKKLIYYIFNNRAVFNVGRRGSEAEGGIYNAPPVVARARTQLYD